MESKITLRVAAETDISAINQVIKAAVMGWQLPERVKRLSLSSYYYAEADLLHLALWVAEDDVANIIAVTGCEPADPLDTPGTSKGLLLHGLYVLPDWHSQRVGQRLLSRVEHYAVDKQYDGVLVKAQTEAVGFFKKQGYQRLPIEDSGRHYAYRLWKAIGN